MALLTTEGQRERESLAAARSRSRVRDEAHLRAQHIHINNQQRPTNTTTDTKADARSRFSPASLRAPAAIGNTLGAPAPRFLPPTQQPPVAAAPGCALRQKPMRECGPNRLCCLAPQNFYQQILCSYYIRTRPPARSLYNNCSHIDTNHTSTHIHTQTYTLLF